ncbi:MAG: bacillolysin [Acidobacteriota bacterium]|jgi:vibriolysin|nr:bacillolysin [Acidobacteriota bacterium]
MKRKFTVLVALLLTQLTATSLFAANSSAARTTGTIHTQEFGNLGTIALPRSSGPRAATNAAEGRSRWSDGAETFVLGYASRRGAVGSESFHAGRVIEDEVGQVHVRLAQSIAGLPVNGAELIVHADAKSGKVVGVNGRFAADRDLDRQPRVNAGAAIEFAAGEFGIAVDRVVGMPELTYIVDDNDAVRLAWSNLVGYQNEDGGQLDLIFADALTGAAIARHPQVMPAKNRDTYTCNNTFTVPGTLLFNEGGSSMDTTAMAAYNNVGTTYDYYINKHSRDSYNGSGATIRQSVHYGTSYNNAAWLNTASQIAYGDGDGTLFSPFAFALDVVAHEFTHGVTRNSANLTYSNESGGLSEAMSDCLGAAAEAYADGGVNGDTWKIGEDCYTPGTAGDAMRYMNDPALAGNKDYYPLRQVGGTDNGGVHTNSGIQNLAFYLVTAGGQHPRGATFFNVAAQGITVAEKIFYRALTVYASSSTNFRQMREYTLQSATDLYGLYSAPYNATWNAWAAVGNNWDTAIITLSPTGTSYNGSSYTPITAGYHTGHLFGPAAQNFDLFLEKWNGSAYVVVASGVTSSTNEIVTYNGAVGQYRWRVTATTGTGQFTLYSNRPR